jgi:hypothetical protein
MTSSPSYCRTITSSPSYCRTITSGIPLLTVCSFVLTNTEPFCCRYSYCLLCSRFLLYSRVFLLSSSQYCAAISTYLLFSFVNRIAQSVSRLSACWMVCGSNPGGARFFVPVHTDPGDHPASCTMGTGSFPEVKSGRGVTLTPQPLLVPWP